jgi:hypothetical protein
MERVPWAAGAQDKQDGVHRVAVGNPRMVPPIAVRLARWEERFHARPQFIGKPPAVVIRHQSHVESLLSSHEARESYRHDFSPTEIGS